MVLAVAGEDEAEADDIVDEAAAAPVAVPCPDIDAGPAVLTRVCVPEAVPLEGAPTPVACDLDVLVLVEEVATAVFLLHVRLYKGALSKLDPMMPKLGDGTVGRAS